MTREDVPSNEMILERARQASKDLRKRFKEDLEQEPKTGHWWERDTYPQECECWDCSECRETVFERTNYCPNCGAKMIEPQESEEE